MKRLELQKEVRVTTLELYPTLDKNGSDTLIRGLSRGIQISVVEGYTGSTTTV